ncbi:hypothetical protein ACS126_12095 [Sphingobacterium lactis]|uniref:hypothetical protein n=1 Tax=Sphingobacterium lactis TaxID=797291 RepID=UPI003EC74298
MKFRSFAETKYLWVIIAVLTIVAIILKSVYRQYIYTHQIDDFGIADSSPNFFAGIIILLMYFTQVQKMSLIRHALFVIIGLVGYELIQGSVFKNNVFDYKDIFASILGVGIGYICVLKFKRSSPIIH